jgi:hypothetical protein
MESTNSAGCLAARLVGAAAGRARGGVRAANAGSVIAAVVGATAGAASSRPKAVAFGADVAAFASADRVVVAFAARRDGAGFDPDRAGAGVAAGLAVVSSGADCGSGGGSGFAGDAFGGSADPVDRRPDGRLGVVLAPALRVDRFFDVAIRSPFAGADGTQAVDLRMHVPKVAARRLGTVSVP